MQIMTIGVAAAVAILDASIAADVNHKICVWSNAAVPSLQKFNDPAVHAVAAGTDMPAQGASNRHRFSATYALCPI